MAVEELPKYAEWLVSFDHRNEAERRFIRARLEKSPALEARRVDLAQAQAKYDKVCAELD